MTNKQVDLLIAKFMGIEYDDYPYIFAGRSFYTFSPSTDMNDTMEVVNMLREQGKALLINTCCYHSIEGERWQYHVSNNNNIPMEGWTYDCPSIDEYGDNLPYLICIVTLKAMRYIK